MRLFYVYDKSVYMTGVQCCHFEILYQFGVISMFKPKDESILFKTYLENIFIVYLYLWHAPTTLPVFPDTLVASNFRSLLLASWVKCLTKWISGRAYVVPSVFSSVVIQILYVLISAMGSQNPQKQISFEWGNWFSQSKANL